MSDLFEDLQQQLAGGHTVLVVGTGVSVAATNRAPAASWEGLLELGVERCVALKPRKEDWAQRTLADLHSSDLNDLLGAATKIERTLKAEGEWSRWLADTVGRLQATRFELLDALGALNAPILTTNYDDLLEERLHRRAITWRDKAEQIAFHRLENREAILHLHGFWRDDESVILDASDYERIVGHRLAQSGLRTMGEVWSLVFIGCGEGLADPNFGPFLAWLGDVLKGARHRHFRLERAADVEARQKSHTDRGDRVRVLSYGDSYDDLPGFLRSLVKASRPAPAPPAKAPNLPGRRLCLGREGYIERLVTELLAPQPRPVPVLGPGGVGKSTVCVEALYDARVAAKYGERRFFVRCDGMKSAGELVTAIGMQLGLPVGTALPEVLATLAKAPTAQVVDNAKTPLDAAQAEVEDLLAQLATVESLGLMVALRRMTRPGNLRWAESMCVEPQKKIRSANATEVVREPAGPTCSSSA